MSKRANKKMRANANKKENLDSGFELICIRDGLQVKLTPCGKTSRNKFAEVIMEVKTHEKFKSVLEKNATKNLAEHENDTTIMLEELLRMLSDTSDLKDSERLNMSEKAFGNALMERCYPYFEGKIKACGNHLEIDEFFYMSLLYCMDLIHVHEVQSLGFNYQIVEETADVKPFIKYNLFNCLWIQSLNEGIKFNRDFFEMECTVSSECGFKNIVDYKNGKPYLELDNITVIDELADKIEEIGLFDYINDGEHVEFTLEVFQALLYKLDSLY